MAQPACTLAPDRWSDAQASAYTSMWFTSYMPGAYMVGVLICLRLNTHVRPSQSHYPGPFVQEFARLVFLFQLSRVPLEHHAALTELFRS